MTAFGLKYLRKNGVFLNKMGDPVKVPEKMGPTHKTKEFEIPAKSSRSKVSAIDQLGGLVTTLIGSNYSKPEDIISKKGINKSKTKIENYISKSEDGYLADDRDKFLNLANQIILLHRAFLTYW